MNFIEYYFPPVLVDQLKNLKYYTKYLRFNDKKRLKKNLELKEIKTNKSAYLLATGPSIKVEDLSILEGEDCFSVSNFFLHEDINKVKPLLHFFAPFHPPLILENIIEWLKLADKLLPSTTNIVLGHHDYELIQKYKLFTNRKVYYLYLCPRANNSSIDLTKRVLAPQTGPLMILPVLLSLGYEKIFLLGCDHTGLRDYKKTTNNFYDKKKDIRVNATNNKNWSEISSHLQTELIVSKQYKYYKSICGDSEIINLSNDSWIDVFKKDRLSNVLKTKKHYFC